jgi:hypothetical protein
MDPPPWRLPPGGPDPRLTCTPFSDGDQALLYDLFLRVVQDIAGADHVSSIPNFQILDCRDSDGSRCIFVRFGGSELTSGVGEDFASVVEQ